MDGVYMRRDDRAIRWQTAAVPRVGESKPDWEIWIDLAGALALDQTGHVEPCGVERLQDVVACRRDEARLRDIGVVRFGLGALEFVVEPGEFPGALPNATLERRIGAFESLGRVHARRDVGEGHDQAAVGHPV